MFFVSGVGAYGLTWTGETGLFTIYSAETLNSGEYGLGLYFNNFDRELVNLEGETGMDLDLSLISVPVGFGLTDRLEIAASFNYTIEETDADGEGGYLYTQYFEDEISESGFGDIHIGLKYRFLDEGAGPGLAAMVFGKIPTADEEKPLGSGEGDYGLNLIASKTIGSVGSHLNLGYTMIGEPDNVDWDDVFSYGLGLEIPAGGLNQFIFELSGATDYDSYRDHNPLDLVLGGRMQTTHGLILGAGLRYAMMMDFDDCPLGGVVMIGFHTPPTPTPTPTPLPNKMPRIRCESDSTRVEQGNYTRIVAIASDPDGDALSYKWQTTGCRLEADGSQARLHTQDCEPGTYTVSCEVSDMRGGVAQCDVAIAVFKPEPVQRRIPFRNIQFKNGSRVDNVAKAILDDIAIQIKRYPEATVTIIGHSDSVGSEDANLKMGMKRAENVKKYLVDRHGIDPDRLITETHGESKPLADNSTAEGRAINRRVEIVMIVEE
ncbi:OmpA family protein [bacterium]|nr:OmpA family protein [candidate division CSSED10-310 bacterium]